LRPVVHFRISTGLRKTSRLIMAGGSHVVMAQG
jgi:hypothetical protein